MENTKAPTAAAIAADVKWTREYLATIRAAKRAGDYVTAASYCMEISAIWATIAGQFDDAANGKGN